MSRKRKKSSILEDLLVIIVYLIEKVIRLIFRLIIFTYDLITYKTSKYGEKSGNGFFKTYFDKGNYGEFIYYRKVIRIFGKASVLTNLYLDNVNTDTTEVDIVAVSDKGIYIFEVKNYGGYIFGSEKDKYWTQVLNRRTKHKFYNPLRQNYAHTMAIKNYLLVEDDSIYPMIVFSNRSKLSKISISDRSHVYQIKDSLRFVKSNEKKGKSILNKKDVEEILLKLLKKCNMTDDVKLKHIQDVISVKNINEN